MSRRKFRVVSGPSRAGVIGYPVALMARHVRFRAAASRYAHNGYAPKGWRLAEWPTDASRERYRLDMVSDHCGEGF